MLKPRAASSSTQETPPQQSLKTMRALRGDMQDADDNKIRQVVALLEKSPETLAFQTILDPLRPRLAVLRPTRALRFTRLLFMPFDSLIVPAQQWKHGDATIPRTILASVSKTVQFALGHELAPIEAMLGAHNTSETEVVARAGQMLWGRAGEILAAAPAPVDWGTTGLRLALYAPLAHAMAVVLRKAASLRDLVREAELGVLKPENQAIEQIVSDVAGHSREGSAMLFKIVLQGLPHTVQMLRRFVQSGANPAGRGLLQTAMECGTGDLLADMEGQSGLTGLLRDHPFADLGSEIQRIATFLQDIDNDPGAAKHHPRLNAIRKKLDTICRERLADGLATHFVAPLAGLAEPVDDIGQRKLESCARDIRMIEMIGRSIGSPAVYDALLASAGKAVQVAAASGSLGRMRAVRLIETLLGPDAAEAIYDKALAPTR